MQNLEDYTPEMLVFYQNLPAPVQNAVRHADVELEDLDSLAVFAEKMCIRDSICPPRPGRTTEKES